MLQVLLKGVQLNIYGNLAIGNIDFLRKAHLLQDAGAKSLWFHDAAAWRTSGKGTEIFRGAHKIGGIYMYWVIYEKWGDLLLEGYSPADSMTYVHTFTLPQLILLFRAHEIPLRALMDSIRTNTYSPEVINMILERLDFKLPGEEGQWWHRRHFRMETPTLIVRQYGDKGYRGPTYRTRRYVSQRAVMVCFYESNRGGIKVTIEPDTFGPEVFHHKGPSLMMELSPKTLRKLLLNWPDKGIMLPERRIDLYDAIASRLEIVELPDPADSGVDSSCQSDLIASAEDVRSALVRSQLPSKAATIFCDLQHFLKWAARFKVGITISHEPPSYCYLGNLILRLIPLSQVPIASEDLVPEGESWFQGLVAEARKEVESQTETVVQLETGAEQVISYHLRLRSTPDPNAARAVLCRQAVSIPDRDIWVETAEHFMFEMCVEATLKDEGNSFSVGAVVRVRKQTEWEKSIQRQAYERRQMMLADAESSQAMVLFRQEEKERQAAERQLLLERHSRAVVLTTSKLCSALQNKLAYRRRQHHISQQVVDKSRVEYVKTFVPILKQLLQLHRSDDGQTNLTFNSDLVGTKLPASSIVVPDDVADDKFKQIGARFRIDRRRHRNLQDRDENKESGRMDTLDFGSEVCSLVTAIPFPRQMLKLTDMDCRLCSRLWFWMANAALWTFATMMRFA